MTTTLTIALYLAFAVGISCAFIGVVYATVIASERSPLDPWFDLLRWMDERSGWFTPLSWIAKPLGACSKCFSGWLAMFASSSLVPWSPDAMGIGFHLVAACSAVIFAETLSHCYRWLRNQI